MEGFSIVKHRLRPRLERVRGIVKGLFHLGAGEAHDVDTVGAQKRIFDVMGEFPDINFFWLFGANHNHLL